MELRILTEPQQGATYAQQSAVAQLAEECGFTGYFCTDHLQREGDADGLPGPADAWTTLSGLARETSRLRLGTLMTCSTFRNPGHLAIIVAQVDQMSRGRVELGLGAGSFAGEHHALGIPLAPARERFERLEEQLALITGLWTARPGEPYSFEGQHHSVRDYPALVRPVQSPHPPIVVGGQGPKRTPALAAKFADEYNTDGVSPAKSAEAYDRVRAACENVGRDPSEITFSAVVTLCCGTRAAEIEQRRDLISAKSGGDFADHLENAAIGSPDQVADRLREFKKAGASRVYLQLFDLTDLDHLRLVAEEVLPQLQ
ncbi:LLM class F420-dependent oxidoreductase [Nonomuraea sp. B1E8]|uniref:LLM class F420-dependent oxidoreductase n=1 Tax=unclassified Nonomuraea TaxID=2593643 RepID=UPI00325C8501